MDERLARPGTPGHASKASRRSAEQVTPTARRSTSALHGSTPVRANPSSVVRRAASAVVGRVRLRGGVRGETVDETRERADAPRVRRMPTAEVIRREGEEDDDQEESGSARLSDFTGDNTPEKYEERLEEALKEANTAVEELAERSVSSSALLAAAKRAVAEASDLVDEVDELTKTIETKKAQADQVADDEAEVLQDDDFDLAYEIQEGFETLLRTALIGQHKLTEAFAEASGRIGLAEDALNQSQAQAQKLSGLRARWGSPALARGHYAKHKDDTGAADEEEYLTRAAALNDKDAGGTIKRKTRSDGDILTMDTATKEFTILSKAGKIRTFFCPGDGIRYFNRQQ